MLAMPEAISNLSNDGCTRSTTMTPDQDRWTANSWDGNSVRKLVTSTTAFVTLNADDQEFLVHKGLLCHFSAHYRMTLESKSNAVGVSNILRLPASTASVFIYWLYSGKLVDASGEDAPDDELINLFVFAHDYGILALRRDIIDLLHRYAREDRCPPVKIDVELAYNSLPRTSPLLGLLVDIYIYHGDDLHYSPGLETLPPQFLTAVMLGKARCLRHVQDSALKVKGPCCGNTCQYHEHESAEEQRASKSNDLPVVRDRVLTFLKRAACNSGTARYLKDTPVERNAIQ